MRLALALTLFSLGCGPAGRDPADRTPLTADCDASDPSRCLLPWPSNAFTVADPDTATGLRVQVAPDRLRVADDPACLNRADGFSRITPVAVGIPGRLAEGVTSDDPAASLDPEAPLQLITVQHDHPLFGTRRPVRTLSRTAEDIAGPQTLVIGRPAELLPEQADHAVVLLDTVGEASPTRDVVVALGLERPDGEGERAIAEHFAPVVDGLVAAGVPLERVVRLSWFTTRSHASATSDLQTMIAAQEAAVADASITVDAVEAHPDPAIARVMRLRLTGMPAFLDEDGVIVRDGSGAPTVVGERDVFVRIILPATDGPWRPALFGHGTGGDYTDDSFDAELAASGIGKVSLRFDGWTGDSFISTGLGFTRALQGTARSTAALSQALSAAPAVLTALDGALGDLLSAETLGGDPNPKAGVGPDLSRPAWLGGSLGGTLGPVVVSSDPRIDLAVFNVPGAGWTHFIADSEIYRMGLGDVIGAAYGQEYDVFHALAMTQGCWDPVDGAVWAAELRDQEAHALLQISMGDPVLPNVGSELLATSLGAVHLGPPLGTIHGLSVDPGPLEGGIAVSQYRVPDEGPFPVHGFAARDTPAGRAALEQIDTFLTTAFDGDPVLAHPSVCADRPDGTCDFGDGW